MPDTDTGWRGLRRRIASHFRLGLFGSTFAVLTALMVISLIVWLQVFFSVEEGPRAQQIAQRVATAVSITRSALIYTAPEMRPALLLDLATKENLRVHAMHDSDVRAPLPPKRYWSRVANQIRERLGMQTQISWAVNEMPGIWISFEIDDKPYWLVFDQELLRATSRVEWLGWGATALFLAVVGAMFSTRLVNRPLAELIRTARQLARGQTPSPLPEQGPAEIRELNIAFNRMVRDIRRTESDRELMLAGISHDLRTPLARMRLEIEMSNIGEEAGQAIDTDLAQIDYTIEQLMGYARPAGIAPGEGVDITAVLREVVDRESVLTRNQGGRLDASIAPGLVARISAHDLKRIMSNLIENARRYGRSALSDTVHIRVTAAGRERDIVIRLTDDGPGIAHEQIETLLRPFSRGELARTGVSGTGLGLAIVERLLYQVGGTLELLPNTPSGLVARITLPRVRPASAHPGIGVESV